MRVVADSHAVVWHLQGSGRLSAPARQALAALPRDLLTDPWDRFIVGIARALDLPLVTRDGAIRGAGLVTTIW